MKPYREHNYYVYILTNISRNVLYVGMTNNLKRRLSEHKQSSITDRKTFTGRYNCIYLVYYERHQWVKNTYAREKEIKGWLRSKKIALVEAFNPTWKFLNDTLDDL